MDWSRRLLSSAVMVWMLRQAAFVRRMMSIVVMGLSLLSQKSGADGLAVRDVIEQFGLAPLA